MTIEILSDVTVELVQSVGSDLGVVHAARISTGADRDSAFDGELVERDKGLINYLMRERHGTPFEHNSITFRVEAPIFVFREWHRHRIQSYNETSGRYSELAPRFYIPDAARPLINVGTSAAPMMEPADVDTIVAVHEEIEDAYHYAWRSYQNLLNLGIAKEVARLVLPVGIMSTMYATANLRAWMSFLSLRVRDEAAAYPTRPQREIEMAGEKISDLLANQFPVSMAAFVKHKSVAP